MKKKAMQFTFEDKFMSNPMVLVICISKYNHEYDDFHSLPGCKIDLKTFSTLWKAYGFKNVLKNENDAVTDDEFWDLMHDARNQIQYDRKTKLIDGIIICYSGHGSSDSLFVSDFDPYGESNTGKGMIKISEIIDWFSGRNITNHLVDAPKFLIADSCRGTGVAEKIKRKLGDGGKGSNDVKLMHGKQDWTQVYSQTDGYKSWDDKTYGGYLVQSISEVLSNTIKLDIEWVKLIKKIRQIAMKKSEARQCIETIESSTCDIFFGAKTGKKQQRTLSLMEDNDDDNYDVDDVKQPSVFQDKGGGKHHNLKQQRKEKNDDVKQTATRREWIIANGKLTKPDCGMIVGYDERNKTIYLLGGKENPNQLSSMNIKNIQSFKTGKPLKYKVYSYANGYCQIGDILYMIDPNDGAIRTFSMTKKKFVKNNIPNYNHHGDKYHSHRCLTNLKDSFLIVSAGYKSRNIEIYHLNKRKWIQNVPHATKTRSHHSCQIMYNKHNQTYWYYTIGGTLDASIEKLNVSNLSQIQKMKAITINSTLSTNSYGKSSVVVNENQIYVIGGCLSDVVDIITVNDQVITGRKLNYGVHYAASIVINGRIYAFGAGSGDYVGKWQYLDL